MFNSLEPKSTILTPLLFLGVCTYPQVDPERIEYIRHLYLHQLFHYPILVFFGDPPKDNDLIDLPEKYIVRPNISKAIDHINVQLPTFMLSFINYFLRETSIPWFSRMNDDCWINTNALPNMFSKLRKYDPIRHDIVFNHWITYRGNTFGQGGSGYLWSRSFVQSVLPCLENKWIPKIRGSEDRHLAAACYSPSIPRFPSPFHLGHGFFDFHTAVNRLKPCPSLDQSFNYTYTSNIGPINEIVFFHFNPPNTLEMRHDQFLYAQQAPPRIQFYNRFARSFLCTADESVM